MKKNTSLIISLTSFAVFSLGLNSHAFAAQRTLLGAKVISVQSSSNFNAGGGNVGTGNSGNGVGNTGPGNQGNDSGNGNAGGGLNTGSDTSTGIANGNSGNDNGHGGNVGTGNSGNGLGNTGSGNQGNDSGNGNAGGNVGTGNSGNGLGNTGSGNQGNDSGNGNAGGDNDNTGNANDSTGTGNDDPPAPQAKPKKELQFDLFPLIYIDLDLGKKLINLTQDRKDDQRAEMDQYSAGFRVIQTGALTAGIGMGGKWHYTGDAGSWGPFAAYVGVLPIVGSKVMTDRFALNKAVANEMTLPELPYLAADAQSMRAGDKISFQSTGGVLFMAGAGLGPIGAGVSLLASGDWITFIEKKASNIVMVKLTNTKLLSFSQSAGSAVIALSLSQFRSADDGFSYTFDLNKADAALAFDDFVRGNLAMTQKMAEISGTGITKDTTFYGKTTGRLGHFWFGIPILLNTVGTKGTIHNVSQTTEHLNGTHTEVEYGMYVKERKTRAFFKHINKTRAFYGVSYLETAPTGLRSSGYFGKFVWSFENDKAVSSSIKSALESLDALTGLGNRFQLTLPESQKMHYAGLRLSAMLSKETTDFLMSNAGNDDFYYPILLKAKALLEKNVTLVSSGEVDEYSANCGFSGFVENRCPDLTYQQTILALKGMKKSLKNMSAAVRSDRKAFSAAYGNFGKAWLTNDITFQAVLEALKGRGIEMTFEAEGERISRFTKVFKP